MKDGRKPYKITVQVTYTLEIPVNALDEDEAVDQFENWVKNSDDYEIVNRSPAKSFNITSVKENWEKINEIKKKNNERRSAGAKIKKL